MALSFSWLPLMFRVRGADMPNPLVVKGKGRPKGSSKFGHSHAKGHGESSTRRDPSLFEHEAIELPSSTAPAALPSRPRERSPELEIIEELSTPSQATQATRAKPSILTTKLAIQRGAGTNDDPYEPGTLRERAYLRSLNPIKLADQVGIEILDTEEEEKALEEEEWLDIDDIELLEEVEKRVQKRVLPNRLTESQLTDTNAPGESIDSFEWEMYNFN